MKIEKTTEIFEISVEKSETFVIRRHREIVFGWCNGCRREVRMSKPEDAAQITGISTRQIYSAIEAGNTHFNESIEGVLLVCINSLDETPRTVYQRQDVRSKSEI